MNTIRLPIGLAMLPWFPRDFRSATLTWPLIARAVYRELLDMQWDAGGLPNDPSELRELVRAQETDWRKAWSYCEPKFPIGEDGLRRNLRLEMHRADSLERRTKARAKASKAAQKRWDDASSNAPSNAHCMPQAMHGQCPPAPSPSPSPSLFLDSGASFGSSRSRARSAAGIPVFHQQVVEAYHHNLPSLPRVKTWTKKRQGALNARIEECVREGKPAETIEYWIEIFNQVSASDFLCGRSTGFRCDLEWLLRAENFLKVIEGRYANTNRSAGIRQQAIVTHEEREKQDLQKLVARRLKMGIVGFRDPLPGESADDYRRAQEAEWERRYEQQKNISSNLSSQALSALRRMT